MYVIFNYIMKLHKLFSIFIVAPISILTAVNLYANTTSQESNWDNLSSTDVPTIITSDAMTLNSKDKNFVYTGNVVLIKGDFRMTSDRLEGKYNDKQGIDELHAFDNINITKGENVKARSNKAVYDKATETMILTENPEVTQEQSILTSDIVRIFLKENRSTAEGHVRVKLIENNGQLQ